jgi:hypothetical protein
VCDVIESVRVSTAPPLERVFTAPPLECVSTVPPLECVSTVPECVSTVPLHFTISLTPLKDLLKECNHPLHVMLVLSSVFHQRAQKSVEVSGVTQKKRKCSLHTFLTTFTSSPAVSVGSVPLSSPIRWIRPRRPPRRLRSGWTRRSWLCSKNYRETTCSSRSLCLLSSSGTILTRRCTTCWYG